MRFLCVVGAGAAVVCANAQHATLPIQPPAQPPIQPPATQACPAAAAEGDLAYPIRKLAFDALTAGNEPEARRLMHCALRVNGADLVALRQVVYLDLNAGDESAAVEDIESLRALHASEPRFDAQQGYIYFHQGKLDRARAAFVRAAAGDDALIRQQALASIQVIDRQYPDHALEIGIDGQYLNRFNDGIVDAYARYFERLGFGLGRRRSPVRGYAGVRLLRDTASQAGPLPQIFSDNALLTGVGLSFQPRGAHYFVSAEANLAYTFFSGRNHTAALVPDFRTVAGYYNVFRPGAGSPLHRFSAEANGSLGFYSRYRHNVIAYVQPQLNYDVSTRPGHHVSVFFQPNFAFDSNREFFNNTAELIPGVQYALTHDLTLRAEYVHGIYLPSAGTNANPYGPSYNDFRVRLTFDRLFFLHGAHAGPPPAGGPH